MGITEHPVNSMPPRPKCVLHELTDSLGMNVASFVMDERVFRYRARHQVCHYISGNRSLYLRLSGSRHRVFRVAPLDGGAESLDAGAMDLRLKALKVRF